jgi:endoglycosylceramidase
MPRAASLLPVLAALLLSCSGGSGSPDPSAPPPAVSTAPCQEPAFAGSPLGLRCGQLVDTAGRVVFVRGVNARVDGVFDVSFADGRAALEPIPAFDASDPPLLRSFGFDALRLPINWSGVEPTESGGFDEAYLDRVAAVVDLAATEQILVLIDFHQDAYSKEIGEDGAPLWAIDPPPTQLLAGPLMDLDTRRLSKQVGDAFTTLHAATDAGDRLRKRFAAMTGHVAQRFAAHPAVLGFELFNEPFFAGAAELGRLHGAAYAAVRAAAPAKLVIFEPSSERNFFDKAPLATAPLGPGTVYAPHTYKLAFANAGDVDQARMTMTRDTLAPQNLNAREEADSWGAGLAFTEWGYDPQGIRADAYLTWQSELQDEVQASAFFWLWKEISQGSWGCFDRDAAGAWTPRPRMQQVLARVRPSAIAGWPRSYQFDRATGAFSLTFTADPTTTGPTVIALAPLLGDPIEATCDGAAITPLPPLDAHHQLALDCGHGTSTEHTVTLKVAPLP